jgi:hypothetical protein
MTILLNRVWFPADQSSKVAKAFVDALKDFPPDAAISKNTGIFVGSTEDGTVLAYGVDEITKGKEKEALVKTTAQNLLMASKIEGLRYKSEVLLDFKEAYKILGITAPEKV